MRSLHHQRRRSHHHLPPTRRAESPQKPQQIDAKIRHLIDAMRRPAARELALAAAESRKNDSGRMTDFATCQESLSTASAPHSLHLCSRTEDPYQAWVDNSPRRPNYYSNSWMVYPFCLVSERMRIGSREPAFRWSFQIARAVAPGRLQVGLAPARGAQPMSKPVC